MMMKYGHLIETYETNSHQTNIAVFTTLSHVCLDCNSVSSLYQPQILKSLGLICDSDAVEPEDRKLANYITNSFLCDLEIRPEVNWFSVIIYPWLNFCVVPLRGD